MENQNSTPPPVTRNTHVRIDFVVREVCPDGSVPEDDLRFIRFGDDVKPGDVRDFFDRASAAMGLMFQSVGAQTLRFVNIGPNKIQVIKTLREVTGLGLREAKDLVEASPGTAIMVIHDAKDAERVRHAFNQAGAQVETRAYHISDTDGPRGTLPPLASYNGVF